MSCLLGETKTSQQHQHHQQQQQSTSSATISNNSASGSGNTNNNKLSNNCNSLSLSQNISHTINSQETCLICGDIASGKHYGLRSCEACKAFFKRTVQGKIEYSCPATRQCEINKRRRKACQACRFQKCLNMGMLKEGVRLDRVRGGRQKYRRGLSPGPNGASPLNSGPNCAGTIGLRTGSNATGSGNSEIGGGMGGGGGGGIEITGINNNGEGVGCNTSGANIIGHSNSSMSVLGNCSVLGSSETNKIMTALISCEPEELMAQFITNIPSNLNMQMKTLYILSDLFDRELVSLIGWAKQIPGFSETITLNDQMRLLQSTWAEVIALSIGFRSHLKRIENQKQQLHGNGSQFFNATPSPTSSSPASTASSYNNHNINGDSTLYSLENTEIRLVFAKDLIIDFKHAVACGAEEIFYNCAQLIKRIDYLKITLKEYILLKAICLTNADVRLENPRATHQLRDLVMDTLFEATLTDSNSITGNNNTVSTLTNIFGQKDNITGNHQIKLEAQDRPLSSMNHCASTSPPRPSSSVQSSSSISSLSSHNNHNINSDINQATSGKKIIINHRLNQVLLCLPILRQIDSSIRKFWNDVRKGPHVPMNKLFEEMLEPCQRNYKSSSEM